MGTENEVMKLVVAYAKAWRFSVTPAATPQQSERVQGYLQDAETELLAGLERFAQERVRQAIAEINEADARAAQEFAASGTPPPPEGRTKFRHGGRLDLGSSDGFEFPGPVKIRFVEDLSSAFPVGPSEASMLEICRQVSLHCATHGLRVRSMQTSQDEGEIKLRIEYVPDERMKEALSVREAADISPAGGGRESGEGAARD